MKKKKNINIIISIILIISIIIFIYSLSKIIKWKIDGKNTNTQIEELNPEKIVEEVKDNENTEIINPPEEEKKSNIYWDYIKMDLINVDFNELLQKNNETKGWIKVNGTNINYPFVQTNNNEYYLNHSYNKKYNEAGWIFVDYRNNMDTFDKNTIIYGHGRLDSTMFASLKNITKSSWYNDQNNHIIKISTLKENTLWQVFSVYIIDETTDYLRTNFANDNDYIEFLNMLKSRSVFNFNTELNEKDTIVTLSTCYNNSKRVVMHAKLIKKEVR